MYCVFYRVFSFLGVKSLVVRNDGTLIGMDRPPVGPWPSSDLKESRLRAEILERGAPRGTGRV